jgi:uncharacterized protein YndB with AHSA1/START domain
MNAEDTRTLVIERQFPHPPEKVWRALTQSELLQEWLLKNDFRPEVGHRFTLRSEPVQQWSGIIDCEVLALEPQKRLSYTWNTDICGGVFATVVTYTLEARDGGTLLRMEQSGFQADQTQNYNGAKYGWANFLGKLEGVLAQL